MGLLGSLGINFGSQKSKGTSDTTSNKTENQSATTNENTSSNTTGTQSTTGSQTGTSTGTTTQTGKESSVGSTGQTSQTAGSQTSLDTNFVKQITDLLGGFAGGALDGAKLATAGLNLGQFDSEKFINDQVFGASQNVINAASQLSNKLASDIGGTGQTNTMAALLNSRINADTNSSLAGIRSNATKTASDIVQSELKALTDSSATQGGVLAQVINAIKGGNISTTEAGNVATQTAQESTTANTGTATESSAQNTASTTESQQSVQTIVEQLLNSLTNTNLVEAVKTTGKNSGFSIGAKLGG